MTLSATVLAESVQTRDGKEYVTVTAMEASPKPLLQMFDYTLRDDERDHKGKLVGKTVELQVETVRAIFAGRPQLSGHLRVSNGK